MARLGVTKEDVFKACEALVSTGVPITVANVRHELGTGSYTTILPLIQEFKARVSVEKPLDVTGSLTLPEIISRQGHDLMEQIWANAWDLAKKEIEDAKAEFAEALLIKEKELQNTTAELSQTLSDLKKYEQEIADLRVELEAQKEKWQKREGEVNLIHSQIAIKETESRTLLERAIRAEKELELTLLRSKT